MASKARVFFRDAKGRFFTPAAPRVHVWVGSKEVHGERRERLVRPRRKTKTEGFPKSYRSPFRKFIVPVSRMRDDERVFALFGVRSVRLYEGQAKHGIIPVEMPLRFQRRKAARAATEEEARDQFASSKTGTRGKVKATKFYGYYALRTQKQRSRIGSPWKKRR